MLHINATAFGGGVSEILYTLVPLMSDVGLDAHWQVILGREEFFNVSKLMHNSLQGDPAVNLPTSSGRSSRALQRDERGDPGRRLGRDHRPRPPADRAADEHPRSGEELDLALPHRPLDPQRENSGADGTPDRDYDASVWHMQQYVPTELDDARGR